MVAPVLGDGEPASVPQPEPPSVGPNTQTDIDEQEQAIAGMYSRLKRKLHTRNSMI